MLINLDFLLSSFFLLSYKSSYILEISAPLISRFYPEYFILQGANTGVHDTVVNQLLSKIDGVDQLNNILVIGWSRCSHKIYLKYIS